MNTLKTMVLMVFLTVMLIAIGGALGGRTGMTFALIMAFGINFISYWFSDKIVLRMYRAREVTEGEAAGALWHRQEACAKGCSPDAESLYGR